MLRFLQYDTIGPPRFYLDICQSVSSEVCTLQRFHGPTHGVDGPLGPVVVRVIERYPELVGSVRQLGDITKPVIHIRRLVPSGLKMSRVPVDLFLFLWLQPW